MLGICVFLCVVFTQVLSQETEEPVTVSCTEGYTYDKAREQCRDIDECKLLEDACKGGMQCVNHYGGYLCLPKSAIIYVTNEVDPPPSSEQVPQVPVIAPNQAHHNRHAGGHRGPQVSQTIRCPSGFSVDEQNNCRGARGCVLLKRQTQEARTGPRPLGDTEKLCCMCDGFMVPPNILPPVDAHKWFIVCRDIDECATGTHSCGPGHTCYNTRGSFTCQCPLGYYENGDSCVDRDECALRHYCMQGCVNTQGSYYCECHPGYKLANNNHSCIDVNECDVENPCQHQCYNLMGSFLCQCNNGFELAADKVSCQDIDECSLSSYMCQFQCVNNPGSYSCECPQGYQLQGNRLCQDINECEMGTHNCQDDEICWNYYGGFRCYPRNPCDSLYTLTSENRCVCPSQAECQGLPPSIVYKYMSIQADRSVPADIFQIQATNMFTNTRNNFRIKAGNEGGEFFLRRSSNLSAMLVLTKPLSGPKEYVVDLEMITHHLTMNYQSSSLLRLTIIVGAYPF